MADSAFDASRYDARRLWVLAWRNDADLFHSGNAVLWDNDTLLVLFTDSADADRLVPKISNRAGRLVGRYEFPSADELSDALARIRDRGVTHVAFDNNGPESERYPIDTVIFQFGIA